MENGSKLESEKHNHAVVVNYLFSKKSDLDKLSKEKIEDKKRHELDFERLKKDFLSKPSEEIFSKKEPEHSEEISEDEYNNLRDQLKESRDPDPLQHWEKSDSDDKYIHTYYRLGKYDKVSRKIVLYIENIKNYLKYGNQEDMLDECKEYVRTHELFHAYFHYVTEQADTRKFKDNYILQVEESLTELCTLVYLEKNKDKSELKKRAFEFAKNEVRKKQNVYGNLAAYGFGFYLYDNKKLEKIKLINAYIKKLGDINENDCLVEEYKRMVRFSYFLKDNQELCLALLQEILGLQPYDEGIINKHISGIKRSQSKSTKNMGNIPQSNFTRKVAVAIQDYFTQLGANPVIFSNELHLKMHLAHFLEDRGYNMFYEYYVPAASLHGNYPWHNRYGNPQELYLDLVVYDSDEFVPIEVKYKTRKLNQNTSVFNVKGSGVNILRDQGAQDLGVYSFWKDVCRLELVCNTYQSVVHNGIALFVTNDPAYSDRTGVNPKTNAKYDYYDFRMTNGRQNINGSMGWQNKNSNLAKKNPGFDFTGTYSIKWNPIGNHSTPRGRGDFSYCLVIV